MDDLEIDKNIDRIIINPNVTFESDHQTAGQSKENSPAQNDITNKGLFFRDGKKRVDYVLVWEETQNDKLRKLAYVKKYLQNLTKAGIELEEDTIKSPTSIQHYVRINVPWDVMCTFAEELFIRAPLEPKDFISQKWSEAILKFLHLPNVFYQDVPNPPVSYVTCPFKKSSLHKFVGSTDHENYFSPTQRHQVAFEILEKTAYGDINKAQIGIERQIEEGIFSAAFPLHEGPYQTLEDDADLNQRQILYKYWARWGCWYKYQPLDHIRNYYGEKIGLYFAWLGLYTSWLLPAAIVGALVFLYGVITVDSHKPTIDACNSGQSIVMCPMCEEGFGCRFWYLSEMCFILKVSYLFDHPGTVFFAIFIVIWAVTFLENWKRLNARLAYHWDVLDYEECQERPRPQYAALCDKMRVNPVTGLKEPYFSACRRYKRLSAAVMCILLMLVLVIIFLISVILYRVLILAPLKQNPILNNFAELFANLSGAMINLLLIMSIGRVYEILALKMTKWEMHRSQSDFENHLTFKVFIFQFINYYSSIFYVAFFKGRFDGYPGNYNYFMGLRNESCGNGGCLIELAQQLIVIMIGKQILNNVQEIFIPKILTWIHQYQHGLNKIDPEDYSEENRDIKMYFRDFKLISYEGLFEEYLEMVLQFGFITIFVAAFPLAPFFALLNNWIEIRLDAQKLVCKTRRPLAERAQNIGIWFRLLEFIVRLSIVSNAFLLAFTSEFLPSVLYYHEFDSELNGYLNFTLATSPAGTTSRECRYRDFRDKNGEFTIFYWKLLMLRLCFVILFEHLAFFFVNLLDFLIPDIPKSLDVRIKREQFLAKEALQDNNLSKLMEFLNEKTKEAKESKHTKVDII